MGLTIGKYFVKIILTLKSRWVYLKDQMCQISINSEYFRFWDQFWPTGSKYFFTKIIFDIKIKIGILETLDAPDFNKF